MEEYTNEYTASIELEGPEDAVRQSILKWEWLQEVGHKRLRTLVEAEEFTLGQSACPMCTWWLIHEKIEMCAECPGYNMCLEQFSFAKAAFNAWRLAKKERELKWEQFQLEVKSVLTALRDIQSEIE